MNHIVVVNKSYSHEPEYALSFDSFDGAKDYVSLQASIINRDVDEDNQVEVDELQLKDRDGDILMSIIPLIN